MADAGPAVALVFAHPEPAGCGAEGEPLAKRLHLILTDAEMPEMDGYEATARILEELGNAAPPIVAVTASASEQDRMDILNAGMCEHVIKPFKKETLIRILLDIQGQQSTEPL